MFLFLSLKPRGFFFGFFFHSSFLRLFCRKAESFLAFPAGDLKSGKRWYQISNPLLCLFWFVPSQPQQKSQFKAARNMKNGCKNNASFLYPTPPNKKKKEGNDAAAFAPAKSLHLPEQTKPKRKDKGGRKPLGQTWTSSGGQKSKKSYQLQKIVHVQNQAVRIWCAANDLWQNPQLQKCRKLKRSWTTYCPRAAVRSGVFSFFFSIPRQEIWTRVFFPDPVATVGIFFFPWFFFLQQLKPKKKRIPIACFSGPSAFWETICQSGAKFFCWAIEKRSWVELHFKSCGWSF